jgi:hypothetical protein
MVVAACTDSSFSGADRKIDGERAGQTVGGKSLPGGADGSDRDGIGSSRDDSEDNESDSNRKNKNDDDGDGKDTYEADDLDSDDSDDSKNSDISDTSDSDKKPEGLIDDGGGSRSAKPDYQACAGLPSKGKRGYGQCADDQVVVVINDGKAQEMTCCAVGRNVLLTEGKHTVRQGTCAANEVATGMQSAAGPQVFCSKINTKFLSLGNPVTAIYVKSSSRGVSQELINLAEIYNVRDTCVCPDKHVLIGGHTTSDNRCADQCVEIKEK